MRKNTRESVEHWFWSRIIKKDSGCWEWQGATVCGYGVVRFQDDDWKAHRLSWLLHNGAIPEGVCVLHTCDNPPCCNPDHLWLGSKHDNTQDMMKKGREGYRSHPCENNGRAKLTADLVRSLRLQHSHHPINYFHTAKNLGVTTSAVRFAVLGITWKNL